MNKVVKKILENIGVYKGLSNKEVEKIYYSQYKVLKRVMEELDYDFTDEIVIRLPFFGSFSLVWSVIKKTPSGMKLYEDHLKRREERSKKYKEIFYSKIINNADNK